MPIHNSAGTSTYTKLSTKNRHSRTHSLSAPRWRGHADNSMPNPHNSRANGRQQPQTSHLDYNTITTRTRLQTTTGDFTAAPRPTPTVLTT